MNPVSILIFNTLLKRQNLNLPGIGSLNIHSIAAEFKNKGAIQPPYNRVELSRQENPAAPNIVDMIAQGNQIERDDAQEIYNHWLTEVCREEGVVIESVGSIRNDFFTPALELDNTLNPVSQKVITLPNRISKKQIWIWVIVSMLIGGGISGGLIVWLNSQDANTQMGSVIPATRLTPAMSAGTDSTTTSYTPSKQSQEQSPEASSGQQTSKPDTQIPVASAPAATPASIASADLKEVRYFVVTGTYSTEANADKFIAKEKSKNPSVNYYKLLLRNGKVMVYTSSAATETEANQDKNSILKIYPDAWVYKHRPR